YDNRLFASRGESNNEVEPGLSPHNRRTTRFQRIFGVALHIRLQLYRSRKMDPTRNHRVKSRQEYKVRSMPLEKMHYVQKISIPFSPPRRFSSLFYLYPQHSAPLGHHNYIDTFRISKT